MGFSSRSSQNQGVVAQVTCSVVGTAAAGGPKSISYSAYKDLKLSIMAVFMQVTFCCFSCLNNLYYHLHKVLQISLHHNAHGFS